MNMSKSYHNNTQIIEYKKSDKQWRIQQVLTTQKFELRHEQSLDLPETWSKPGQFFDLLLNILDRFWHIVW